MVGVAISGLEPTVWREGRFISPEPRVYRLRHSSCCNLRICGEEHPATGCVSQWTNDGKRVIVFPESIAEGNIKLPEWVKTQK